ncbi:DUF655 domain-containing protein [Methanothermococcus okinawensis]|uniref:Nucleotide binding protein n=1 Tax=Methanothermococcus okinawensis (strain DSM 14208 / JCM 11175 / IH1) TaxID=647113 RepID=F8AN28_METOI|nr:DUF655 domain-containing protein [Methanothermococcus okinawensis]AEH06942.1 protein of unknown function DUF655 [Methanothermococcus okinawensis IH1]
MKKYKSKKRKFENYAYVLDFLEYGYPDDKRPLHQRKPIAQGFGEKQFVLMELVLKDDKTVEIGERVYIGKGKRDKVEYISRMLKYEELTPTAKTELFYVIKEAVKRNEKKFIQFINECGPITNKMHSLQLLPGIGKTTMWKIIEEREAKPFESFEDVEKRVHRNLLDAISKRIEEELKEPQKYYLFVQWKEHQQ